ncbi:MAG: hypothetical protein AAB562_00585 [Patescibacteria group bacterium]
MTENSEFFVGWFTLAMAIAGIAQGKNRSGFGWFLLGLIAGPFALAILLLCGKLRAKYTYDEGDEEGETEDGVAPAEEASAPPKAAAS